ncbi:MAG: ABC transporter ATP-binding protein [Planctomycetes bacterium]|nr:ABC transporter ATP-binding protein [Planctomycetota bacterium]
MTVQLDNVTIRYGERVAVDGITARIPAGAVGLLGRNGAGKSSILKALLGLVRPSAGRMAILDLPENAAPDEIRARVGYMPERDGHLPGLSGFEMVSLLGRLSGLRERDAWRRAHEVLYLVGLDEQRYRPVSGYSTGMRQKVKLAAALVHDPQVLFLDEPTNGLDPSGREEMLSLVRQLSRDLGKSVVLSTHILQDVEAVCDAVVVLERGRLVAEGPLRELTRTTDDQYRLQIEPADLQLPERLPGLELRSMPGGGYHVRLVAPASPRAVFAAVHAAGGVVRQLERQRRSLEDVFLGALASGGAA